MQNKKLLTDLEYQEIKNRLKREPNKTEIYLFSAMWSEHCGYGHSKKYLSRFPSAGSLHSQENAGGVQIGNQAIFFKVESHNHPSAVEPFQGAATGIGGIIRDILALGARPIALLNSLKFGKITSYSELHSKQDSLHVVGLANPTYFSNVALNAAQNNTKHLFEGVVKGISVYGNSIGVPTVGGEIGFDTCYTSSPLVNVMAVGLVDVKDIKTSAASTNQYVVIVGSHTGRDGIHGASFASKELSENSKEDRPSVQIADPFMKKILIEATLEILKSDDVFACQDCGAAGILSSTSEMAYKGNCGMELYLDKVHLREKNMQPWEIMLSESQERMIFTANKKGVEKILEIAQKYEIPASEIGKTIEEKDYRLFYKGEQVANVSPEILNNGILYDLCEDEPEYIQEYENKICNEEINIEEAVKKLVSDPNFASKNWVYFQYDYTVGNRTCIMPESAGAAGALLKKSQGIIGLTMDSNGRQVFLDPYNGSKNTVYESYRNLVSSGFKPLGITNCLNYGNPEKDEVGYQFVKSIDGIADACKELSIPVVSGNVSFYNECEIKKNLKTNEYFHTIPSPLGGEGEFQNEERVLEILGEGYNRVYPTPTIGMVGVCPKYEDIILAKFEPNQNVYLIGKQISNDSKIGASLYQMTCFEFLGGKIDTIDVDLEKNLEKTIFALRDKKVLTGAVDVSEGGLLGALLEGLFNGNSGFEGSLIKTKNKIISLFGEITGRYIISTNNENEFEKCCKKHKVPFLKLGKTTNSNEISFDGYKFSLVELKNIYKTVIQKEIENVQP